MEWKKKENQRLLEALLTLKTPEQAERFLRDLMTESEITEFAKRLQTAEMLLQKVPYSTIEKQTGFSSTTVARVSKWLANGTGGYKEVIENLHYNNPTKFGKGLSLT